MDKIKLTEIDILKLWFDWAKSKDPIIESQGRMFCFFCGGRYYIYGKENHEIDCIYKLTDGYLNPTTAEGSDG